MRSKLRNEWVHVSKKLEKKHMSDMYRSLRKSEQRMMSSRVPASGRFPHFEFDIEELRSDSHEDIVNLQKTDRARVLIESDRFPPFGFDIKEIGSDSHEDIVNLQKN